MFFTSWSIIYWNNNIFLKNITQINTLIGIPQGSMSHGSFRAYTGFYNNFFFNFIDQHMFSYSLF